MNDLAPKAPSCRVATFEDAVALGMLVQDALDEAPSAELRSRELDDDPIDIGRDLIEVAEMREGGLVVVAEIGSRLAGFARALPRDLVRARHVGETLLLVHPRARARGVGTAVLHALASSARAGGQLGKLVVRVASDDRILLRLLMRAGWHRERQEGAAMDRGGVLCDIEVWARHLDDAIRDGELC